MLAGGNGATADDRRDDALRRIAQRVEPGATLRRAWPLAGGVSAQLTALEIERPDGTSAKLVVRRHGEADRGRNPRIARAEFGLLRLVRDRGVAAPTPLFFDESGELLPTPFLIVEFVEGETDFAPADLDGFLAQAAGELAKIHAVGDPADLAFLPRQAPEVGERPVVLDDLLGEGRVRDALDAAGPVAMRNGPVLLHGDYWPGNLLWQDGWLVAVVDWEDARVGDPLSDLANARLEFLWAFGLDAMRAFTDRYRSLATVDVAALPWWDLRAALGPCSKLAGWGLDGATEERMRGQHRSFVDQALEAMPGGRPVAPHR